MVFSKCLEIDFWQSQSSNASQEVFFPVFQKPLKRNSFQKCLWQSDAHFSHNFLTSDPVLDLISKALLWSLFPLKINCLRKLQISSFHICISCVSLVFLGSKQFSKLYFQSCVEFSIISLWILGCILYFTFFQPFNLKFYYLFFFFFFRSIWHQQHPVPARDLPSRNVQQSHQLRHEPPAHHRSQTEELSDQGGVSAQRYLAGFLCQLTFELSHKSVSQPLGISEKKYIYCVLI